MIAQARDALTVKRVFGEPYERNGVRLLGLALLFEGLRRGRSFCSGFRSCPWWPCGAYPPTRFSRPI